MTAKKVCVHGQLLVPKMTLVSTWASRTLTRLSLLMSKALDVEPARTALTSLWRSVTLTDPSPFRSQRLVAAAGTISIASIKGHCTFGVKVIERLLPVIETLLNVFTSALVDPTRA